MVKLTKDILFDHELDLTTDIAGEEPYQREWNDPTSYVSNSLRAVAPKELHGAMTCIPMVS